MRGMAVASVVALLLGISPILAQSPKSVVWDFEDGTPGKLPAGWMATKTGDGPGSVWSITVDATAPKGKQVLSQTAVGHNTLFNLCVLEKSSYGDLELSVQIRANQGKLDQGGGLVWRYIDANNYYVCRYNPLENNLRLYHVVNGKRTQLKTQEGLSEKAHAWHTLKIQMKGDAITCWLNGRKHFDVKDTTFPKAGKIGLWAKADAQTSFDDLQVTPVGK